MAEQYLKRRMPPTAAEHLDMEYKRAQIEAARAKPQFQLEKTNDGKIVSIDRAGRPHVVYDGGPDFSKLPEYSAKSAGFAARMVDAERNLRSMMADAKAFDPTAGTTAMVNALPEGAANWIRGPQHQAYRQAARQWIRAFLRKESGAAISDGEFAQDFMTYFPQPGDSKEVVAQKEAARLEATRSFIGETRGFFAKNNPEADAQFRSWQTPGTPKQAPPEALQMLRSNPTPKMRAQFDEIFGAGAADRVLGGGR
jgi:hypothetical protein